LQRIDAISQLLYIARDKSLEITKGGANEKKPSLIGYKVHNNQ
jgi:hypothetical protein